MIVLDTCSATKCFSLSKNWLDRLKKCCADKTIIWSTTTNYELIGLSKSNKSLKDLLERLSSAENVRDFDIKDLSDEDYLVYVTFLLDISKNDTKLLFDQFPTEKMSLDALQSSGKNRLSSEDKELIALSKVLNATLATDDTRMLKILDTFYSSQPYICSPKIIEKIKNITTLQELKDICHKKEVWIYANYHTNKTTVC